MTNHTYVPVLRTKQGELYGVRDLDTSVKTNIFPLLDITRQKSSLNLLETRIAVEKNLLNLPKYLADIKNVFIDSSELSPNLLLDKGVHPLSRMAEILIGAEIKVIPVSGLARDEAHWKAASDISKNIASDSLCIRIEDYDLETPTESASLFLNILKSKNLIYENIYIIFDLRDVFDKDALLLTSRIVTFINALKSSSFKTLIIAGCGIPSPLSQAVKTKDNGYIPRVEKSIYKNTRKILGKYHDIVFGDYATVNPAQEEIEWYIVQNTMGPKAIYTLDDQWFVIRGGSFKRHPKKRAQYYDLAKEITKLSEFSGNTFSAGDKYISDKANEIGTAGSPRTWISACVNHHITHTVRELAILR